MAREARSLSGGEQQRVSLARTLVGRPEVLLLDEVTSALNQASAEDIEGLISKLSADEGLSVVWVTHDLNQAVRVGDMTALMVEGRIVECAPTERLFSSPENSATWSYLQENWQVRGERP
jgi:putative ABC transport system ATP-binding protein